ncbi:SRPBCC family protein [Microbacterium sp. HD4P20]|uniref:SRPBCC family protein n=1 Tax=Microbacterium sp. HD4P20 TaxID=2864874 RepID=UPI001C641E31|nr:SRPBCC family protein [Microbacterium sp. HD4P20]MCP2638208.1 SRPBCC family protein [Microbacterium sp. HD4P20]
MASVFRIVTLADHEPQALFDASLSIDAHVRSMAGSREKAIAGVTSGSIGLGETVTWRARHFGVWFTMTSRISELHRPHRFVDEQASGPFRLFRHVHEFDAHGDGCRMTDEITVASPVFGVVAERLVLVPYLRRLIARRNEHLVGSLG